MVMELKVYKNIVVLLCDFVDKKDAFVSKDVPSFTMCTIKIMKGYKQN